MLFSSSGNLCLEVRNPFVHPYFMSEELNVSWRSDRSWKISVSILVIYLAQNAIWFRVFVCLMQRSRSMPMQDMRIRIGTFSAKCVARIRSNISRHVLLSSSKRIATLINQQLMHLLISVRSQGEEFSFNFSFNSTRYDNFSFYIRIKISFLLIKKGGEIFPPRVIAWLRYCHRAFVN